MDKILFFCAHNDDQVIGAGGTIAKYAKEGKEVYTVIFSHGEKSHPHMKPEHIIPTRIKEAKLCDKSLGGKGITFLNLNEGKFVEEFDKQNLNKKIKEMILKLKPSKIFLHGIDDPHPDHQAVFKIISKLISDIKFKGDVYMYDVWTLINLRKRNEPKMIVDISNTLKIKIKAFKLHKTQQTAILTLLWSIYLKAFIIGLNNGYKSAESFQKLK